jgi:hypothetical protein
MRRPTRERKEKVSLQKADLGDVRQGSLLNQNIYFERDNSRQMTNFLNNLASFAQERAVGEARESAKEQRAALEAQAQADVAAGEIDDDLLANQQVYRESVSLIQGHNAGLEARASILQDAMREAEIQGPGFDYNAYAEERVRELTESDAFQDPQFAAAASEQLGLLEQEITSAAVKRQAELEIQEGELTAQQVAFTMFRTGTWDFEEFNAQTEEIGLTPSEKTAAKIGGAISAMDQAKSLDDLKALDALMESLPESQKAQYGDDLQKAYRTAERRLLAAEGKQNNARTLEEILRRRALKESYLNDEVGTEHLFAARESGLLSDSEVETLVNQRIDAEEAFQAEVALEQEYIGVMEMGPEALALRGSEFQRGFTEWYNEASREVGDQVMSLALQARSGADPDGVRQQIREVLEADAHIVRGMQELGIRPPWLKGYLATAKDPATPAMESIAMVTETMEGMFGTGILADVPDDVRANIRAYRKLTQTMSHEEAQAVLTTRSASPAAFTARVVKADKDFQKAVEDILEDNPSGTADAEEFTDMVTRYYAMHNDMDWALEQAEADWQDTTVKIDGRTWRSADLPTGFAEVYEDNKDRLGERLAQAGVIGEGDEFALRPVPGLDGEFEILNVTQGLWGSAPQGGRVRMNTQELFEAMGRFELEDKKAAEAAKAERLKTQARYADEARELEQQFNGVIR